MTELMVRDLMWSDGVAMISPDAALQDAAAMMVKKNCGVLPVGTGNKVEGIITDRDIVVRAVAADKIPSRELVRGYMTTGVHTCKEDDTVKKAAQLMKKHKVGRLAVMDNQNRLAGILSFGHIIRNDANAEELVDIVTCASSRDSTRSTQAAW